MIRIPIITKLINNFDKLSQASGVSLQPEQPKIKAHDVLVRYNI